jgi:hypothetical protein
MIKKYWFLGIPIIFVIYRYMENKEFLKKFIDHIQRWEGKLGGSPKDTGAIKNGGYAPGTKYHTSKGVTWGTYKNFCTKYGYPIKVSRWLEMPIDLWTKILNKVFIEKWNLDKLKLVNPKLAYFIIEVAWMSSNMGAEKFFANYLRSKGIYDNDIKPNEMQKYFLELIANGDLDMNELYQARFNQYKTFHNYDEYGNGWENRLNAYIKL